MTTICKKNYKRRTEEEELLVIPNSAVEDQDPEDRLQLHMKKIIKKNQVNDQDNNQVDKSNI